jgi:hypothetical protein
LSWSSWWTEGWRLELFFCRLTIWVVYRHVMLLFWKCMARVHG